MPTKIKGVYVRLACSFCDGEGCRICRNLGYYEEWVSFTYFMYAVLNSFEEKPK